ncbi:hypothetical protein SUGI_0394360 [Cryptomeria japonica]|nr:hypothetical protein SUGI_0394360 [Cryptomeria japonica]
MDMESNSKARIAIYQIEGEASLWWDHLSAIREYSPKDMTWEKFKRQFHKEYLSARHRDQKMTEFHTLHQGTMTMNEYKAKFMSLLQHVHYLKEEEDRVNKFILWLNKNLIYTTKLAQPKNLSQAVEITLVVEKKRKS